MVFTLVLASALENPAQAVDLDALVEAWTLQIDGALQGPDAALGTALDSDGQVVVVGYLSREEEHGTDGYAAAYAPDSSLVWEIIEDVGPIGPDRTSSDDLLYDISIDPLFGYLSMCGSRGMEALTDPDRRYLLETYEPDPLGGIPLPAWPTPLAYIDGQAATSPVQECRGTLWTTGYVYAAGWGLHNDADAGRWISWKFDETNGSIDLSLFHDVSAFEVVPDQALDISVNSATAEIAIVGTQGFAGSEGSLLNDTDWHVRYYDSVGTLLWEDTLAGASQLEDRALAVQAEVATGDLYVAGYENRGTDNAGNADEDWVVIRYDGDGDGLGGPLRSWTHTWESASGASEGATSLALDDLGDLLVGGYAIDPATGLEQWRVAKLASSDGTLVQEWFGPVWGGDARLEAIDFRDGKIALAGSIADSGDTDFAVAVIEGDDDEDGVADSVDACPVDPDKSADEGVCGCNVPDVDTDGDSVENCLEECASDPDKQLPGICGCGEPDLDADGDLTFDCDDDCPDDPGKIAWGECGCGSPDTDTDGDGILGCRDACSNTPPNTPIDAFGCPIEDGSPTGDTGEKATDVSTGGGCQCSAASATGGLAPQGLLLFAVLLARRINRRSFG